MKILFITDLYPVVAEEKTTPKTLLNFVEGWQKAGHNVEIIKPNFLLNSFLRKKPFYKTGQYGNIFNMNFWLPFVFNPPSHVPNFDADSYDLIIAHMPSGILFADKIGKPFVAGVHNSDLEVLTKPLYSLYFKPRLLKALKNAKAIACRSFVLREKLLKLYPEFGNKTFVCPSGIDERIIVEPNGEFSNPIKVLCVANAKKRKNVDKLVKAVGNLPEFELQIVGEGYTGWLPHEKVLEKMRAADIFILPSVGETFGLVYLEAMASGCITICTRNDGIDGIIKDGENGFTVEPDSIQETLLRIKNMDVDQLKKIRYNSYETVKNYTNEKCSQSYLEQISKFLGEDNV